MNFICHLELDFSKFLLSLLICFNITRLVGVRVHPIYVDFFCLFKEFLKHLINLLQAEHFLYLFNIVHFWCRQIWLFSKVAVFIRTPKYHKIKVIRNFWFYFIGYMDRNNIYLENLLISDHRHKCFLNQIF